MVGGLQYIALFDEHISKSIDYNELCESMERAYPHILLKSELTYYRQALECVQLVDLKELLVQIHEEVENSR